MYDEHRTLTRVQEHLDVQGKGIDSQLDGLKAYFIWYRSKRLAAYTLSTIYSMV